MTMPRILIVEDERIFALDLEARLEANGFPVVGTTATADGAVALASSCRPDVILMDIHLDGERDGISAAREIQDTLQIPVVFLTAYAENEIVASSCSAQFTSAASICPSTSPGTSPSFTLNSGSSAR